MRVVGTLPAVSDPRAEFARQDNVGEGGFFEKERLLGWAKNATVETLNFDT
jgi:hypothetical protein